MSPVSSSDIEAFKASLKGKSGRALWRSLEEWAHQPSFSGAKNDEFPHGAFPVSRRFMLRAGAASLALAGLAGCGAVPDEAAMPYVNAPEFTVPGKAKWYATSVIFSGFAQPALGKTYVGRPVKLEGNPDHPASAGLSDSFLQTALFDLYDPARSQSPRLLGRIAAWGDFDAEMTAERQRLDRTQGDGFRMLTGTVTSPTLKRQIDALTSRWPKARWHVLEPVNDDLRRVSTRRVFGRSLDLHPMLDQAEVVVSLDDDLLGPGPRQILNARRWSLRRRAFHAGTGGSELFVAEPTPSLTGTRADDRLVAGAGRIDALARAIAAGLAVEGVDDSPALSDGERRWVETAVTALKAVGARGFLTIGAHHAPETQAIGFLINDKLGSLGMTLRASDPIAVAPPDGEKSFAALVEAMASGAVHTLAIIDANPVHTAPADFDFANALAKVKFSLHASCRYDDSASRCRWHVPLAHGLESWSDARAVDGTLSIVQPLVQPFYAVRPLHALIDGLMGGTARDREIVQATWRAAWNDGFDDRWRTTVQTGLVADSAAPFVTPTIVDGSIPAAPRQAQSGLHIIVRPDPAIWDGRFAGNGWLEELPRPFTKLTWGNAILISPQLAAARHLTNGDEILLEADGGAITGPVWIVPGQQENTLTITLGYGARQPDRTDDELGYDGYRLQRSDRPWLIEDARITPTGRRRTLATTQPYQAIDGYDFIHTIPPGDIDAVQSSAPPSQPSFYPPKPTESPSWGMAIDLDLCIGCNACISACVAENNIAVVGKDHVAEGRQMHWLRVDHYYAGDPAAPKSYFQPVPCMHCEDAPCEMGCPVNAAVHSIDGLNLQVYNRCIGTRTCSSYCPYKVRRFNFFDYTEDDPEPLRAMRNPDVTVRGRGVMEKCTYCVQRISEARIGADLENRPIRDGEIRTACQQACPTQAITFGDVTDPKSEVSRRKAVKRNYALLPEENTRPRTTYLARVETSAGLEVTKG